MRFTEINVTMELVSSFVVVVLIFSQMIKKNKTRQDWYFLCMLGVHMVCTLSDAVNWAFDTKEGEICLVLTRTGNFLSYFASALAYVPFVLYIMENNSSKKKIGRVIFRLACCVSVLMVLFCIVNLFTGALYWIDENNRFYWGNWDWLFNLLVLIQLVLAFLEILISKSAMDRKDMLTLMSYEFLPIIAIFVNIFFADLTLVYPATMLSLLLLYVNVQQEQEKRLARKEVELIESHTAVMLSQIRPHFLYNVLTAVGNLCGSDPDKAQKAISDFARYLRGNMKALTQREPVPFEEELKHIRYYLNLEQVRFGSKLHVVMEIGPKDFFVPVLSVQPFVENAVKHGISRRRSGGTVVLRTESTPRAWVVTVCDDGVGFDPAFLENSGKEHVGIVNTRDRLRSVAGGDLEIESRPGKGTSVKISIPKEAERNEYIGG